MSDHTWRRTCRLAMVQPRNRCLKSETIKKKLQPGYFQSSELWLLLPRTLRCTLQSSSLSVCPNSVDAFNCMLSTVEAAFYWPVMSFPLVNLKSGRHAACFVLQLVFPVLFQDSFRGCFHIVVLVLCHLWGSWPYKDVRTVCGGLGPEWWYCPEKVEKATSKGSKTDDWQWTAVSRRG